MSAGHVDAVALSGLYRVSNTQWRLSQGQIPPQWRQALHVHVDEI